MERIKKFWIRQKVADMYNERLKNVAGVKVPYIHPKVKMSWFVYVIRLERGIDRNKVMEYLLSNGIGCRPYFTSIHLQPFYREMGYKEGDFPVTEAVAKTTIALPFYNNLTEEEIDYVVEKLKEALSMA